MPQRDPPRGPVGPAAAGSDGDANDPTPGIDRNAPSTASPAAADDSFTDIMALAIEGSGIGLWDRNVATGEIRYSPGWKAILGYPASELSNRIEEAYTRVHPDDIAYVQAAMQAHFDGRTRIYEVEHRLRCKDGSWKWVLSRGKVVARDAGGRALRMVGTTTDITATRSLADRLRNAEGELQVQREQLFQAQKMVAVGQLTGGLAHDFNNILTGITGSLELMRMRLAQGQPDDVERYLSAALDAASRAAALTHRLLTFARRQTPEAKPTDPNDLIADMAELLQRTVGPQFRIATKLAADVWRICCDPNQLESSILNLCINARDAMPAGGTIMVETANASLDEESGRRHDVPPGEYVVISVADTGSGMSPEVLAQVFDPFYTTKPPGQGTGLGLPMVYGFAKRSGGHARIQSRSGSGTTVRIYLPGMRPGTPSTLPASSHHS